MKFANWILFAALIALTGCGGGGNSTASEPSPEPVVVTPTGPLLPDDPGEAGLATIAGIDSDNDGVRDDLQRFVVEEFPDTETMQDALLQTAIALQDQLLGNSSKELALRAAQKTMRAVECVYSVDNDWSERERSDALAELEARVLNTNDRLLAYAAFDEQVWGEIIVSLPIRQHNTSCES